MVNENNTIQSVERAMLILEALAAFHGRARLQQLSDATALNKTTLHGLLNTLVALGYVTREEKFYVLGLRLLDLSRPLRERDECLREWFMPVAQQVADFCGENVYLAVPCGTREYWYLHHIGEDDYVQGLSRRGRREGLTTSAMGKVFLSFMDDMARSLRKHNQLDGTLKQELVQIRAQGFALDLGVAQENWYAFAVPLWLNGRVVAGLSVASDKERLPETRLRELAREISQWQQLSLLQDLS